LCNINIINQETVRNVQLIHLYLSVPTIAYTENKLSFATSDPKRRQFNK